MAAWLICSIIEAKNTAKPKSHLRKRRNYWDY
jgi:hypothetical protein